jgi:hypothetical protein
MMDVEEEIACRSEVNYVGFKVLTAVVMKNYIFWNITPCSPVKVNRRLRAACPSSSGSKSVPSKKAAWHFLLGLLFDPEDGSNMFLRLSPVCTASYSEIQNV